MWNLPEKNDQAFQNVASADPNHADGRGMTAKFFA